MATWLLASGCGGAPRCARSSECDRGAVCGLSGECGTLRPPAGARFAASRWLEPIDWGVAAARGPLTDAMPVGGSSEALLAFGPLPEPSRVVRALLVLSPHASGPRVSEPAEVVVEHVGPFRGGPLPPRHGTTPTEFAAARRLVPEGPAHRLRLDVSEAARSTREGSLHLLVRLRGDAELRFASPWAEDVASRPRLELMVR
ncbi:MAG: hypothetical protein H6719_01285 [Sandaracinaceae bacterium]|nr:hypothetical protein [Sandaracinaceae bacterium]